MRMPKKSASLDARCSIRQILSWRRCCRGVPICGQGDDQRAVNRKWHESALLPLQLVQCLRYSTVCAVMCAFCFAALDDRSSIFAPCHGMYCHYTHSSGWPFVCVTWQVSKPTALVAPSESQQIESPRKYAALGCWVNLLSFFAMTGSSFFIAHYKLPKLRPFRYSLSTLFIAIVVACALFCILRFERDPMTRVAAGMLCESNTYYPVTLYSWCVFVPVLYGAMCVVTVACLLVNCGVQELSRRIDLCRELRSKQFGGRP